MESQREEESKNLRRDNVQCTKDFFIFSFTHLLIYLIAQYWSILCLTPFGDDVIHDREDLGEGFGTEESDAGLLEVIKTFEDRRGSKMTT